MLPFTSEAFPYRAPELQLLDVATHEVLDQWTVFGAQYQGGVSVVAGDVDGDGEQELIVAQSGGPDASGLIRIYSSDHTLLKQVRIVTDAHSPTHIDLAAGDVDGDGKDEVVVSFPEEQRSFVALLNDQLSFDPLTVGLFEAFPGVETGAVVAIGQLTTDDTPDILVGTSAGVSARVQPFSAQGLPMLPHIQPTLASVEQGLTLTTLKAEKNEPSHVVIGARNGGYTDVEVYVYDASRIPHRESTFRTWTKEFQSGVELTPIDVDANGTEEIAIVPAGDQRADVRFFRPDGAYIETTPLQLFEEDFRGGVDIAQFRTSRNQQTLAVVPRAQLQRADLTRGEKYIEVDLSEQVTRLWEGGFMRQTYLISSGLPGTPTPQGDFSILAKIERHVYDGRPVYYFPNTPWNLRYKAGGTGSNYYFHTAYWHNNFGHPMSHGCVNMREPDARFLYQWAEVGTPAWIHE